MADSESCTPGNAQITIDLSGERDAVVTTAQSHANVTVNLRRISQTNIVVTAAAAVGELAADLVATRQFL